MRGRKGIYKNICLFHKMNSGFIVAVLLWLLLGRIAEGDDGEGMQIGWQIQYLFYRCHLFCKGSYANHNAT